MRPSQVGPAVIAAAALAAVTLGVAALPRLDLPSVGEGDVVATTVTALCGIGQNEQRAVQAVIARGDSPTQGQLEAADLGDEQTWQIDPGDSISERIRTGPVRVRAEGTDPIPYAGSLITRAATGATRGLAAQPCTRPATEHWLPGLAATEDHRSQLVISNPDPSAAEVDLQFYSDQGPVQAAGGSGISIPPRGTRTVALDGLVEAESLLTAQVRATAGRISVVAAEEYGRGNDVRGAEWMTPAAAPATQQMLTGIPTGEGAADLVLINPGDRTTSVGVEVMGAEGAFAPVGADRVDLPPQATVRLDLAQALSQARVGDGQSLRLTADRDFTASMIVGRTAGSRARDAARPVATSALGPLGAVAVDTTVDAASLTVANPGTAEAEVRVTATGADGAAVSDLTVTLGPGVARAVPLESPATTVVVQSTGPQVHAAVALTSDADQVAGVSWLPVTSAGEYGTVSRARPDPGVGR